MITVRDFELPRTRHRFRVRLALTLGVAACQGAAAPPPFRSIGQTSRIVVVANHGVDTLATITDTARIRALVAFVDARRDGWKVPWFGVPIPRVTAGFFRTADARGAVHYFGAGPGFFEASSQPGDFASRSASAPEVSEFLRLVGAPANAVDPR